jgi:DNA-binding NarL/FixJ family response regulator/transcriptional regulator with XRE-family HTH domain
MKTEETAGHEGASFGALLKCYRLAAGLSQEGLAERARLSVKAVSAYEQGLRRVPYRETVALLVEALGLAVSEAAVLAASVPRRRGPAGLSTAAPRRLALAPRMVGRQAQLKGLEEHLRGVRAGSCRVVLVAGEAGVGKTCLLRAFLERAQDQTGIEVLQGYCYEEQPPAPYGPFLDALRAFVRDRGPGALLAAAGPLGGDLLLLLPELELPATTTVLACDPQGQKQRLFEALYRILRPPATGCCRIVVIEDLHWADQTSQELLRYVARAAEREALLLLGSYRADGLHHRHPLTQLLDQLTRDRVLHEVQIAPLSTEDLAQMLEATLERSLPAPFVAEMADRTGGNPFFVEEVLRALLDRGQLDEAIRAARAGAAGRHPVIPPTVKRSIRSRTADLDPAAGDALRYAAVVGRQFDLEILQRLTGLEEGALVRAIEGLVDRQVVVEERDSLEDRYHFRHALTREAIYDDLLRLDRRQRHQAVLRALEELYPARGDSVLDQLAYHSRQAGELGKAARYAEQAGDRSARMSAFREAMGHYQTALELQQAHDPRERADLLVRQAGVAFPLGDVAVYERCWREAQHLFVQIGDRRRAGEISSQVGHTAQDRGDMAAALAHHQAAIAMLEAEPPGPELAMAYGEIATCQRNCFRSHEAIAWGEKAQRLAETLGEQRILADALVTIGAALHDRGEWRRGIDYLDRALALAREANFVQSTLRVYSYLVAHWVIVGEFGRAAALYGEGMALARQFGWETRMGGDCAPDGGLALMELGRWEQAHEALDRGLRAAELGHPFARFDAAAWKAVLLLREGRHDAARQLLEDLLPAFEARGDPAGFLYVFLALALVRSALADHAGALQAMDRAIALWRGVGSPAWGSWLLRGGIDVYLSAGREVQARGLLPDLAALAKRSDTPVAHAVLADAEGQVAAGHGGHGETAEAFRRAAALWREMGATYNEARSRCGLAASLLQTGDRGRRNAAMAELASAQTICTRLGAPLEEIATTVRQHGSAVQPIVSRTYGLTRREREVIALVAQGCSNRAIAERLVISEKTAENHVGNILGKLGLPSRAQAAAYAVEQGLARSSTP